MYVSSKLNLNSMENYLKACSCKKDKTFFVKKNCGFINSEFVKIVCLRDQVELKYAAEDGGGRDGGLFA